jgi:hypothetical protein
MQRAVGDEPADRSCGEASGRRRARPCRVEERHAAENVECQPAPQTESPDEGRAVHAPVGQ